MQDPAIARALQAIHTDVGASWTVAELASMSRSAFSARFGEVLGCAPIEYLMRWRMAIAKDALARGNKTLDRIAEIGYESASAFSTAFVSASDARPASSRAPQPEPIHRERFYPLRKANSLFNNACCLSLG